MFFSLSGSFFCQAVYMKWKLKHLWCLISQTRSSFKQKGKINQKQTKQREEMEQDCFSFLIYSVTPLSQFSLSCVTLGDWDAMLGYNVCLFTRLPVGDISIHKPWDCYCSELRCSRSLNCNTCNSPNTNPLLALTTCQYASVSCVWCRPACAEGKARRECEQSPFTC